MDSQGGGSAVNLSDFCIFLVVNSNSSSFIIHDSVCDGC